MTTRYTDEEWVTFIEEVERDVVVAKEPYPYPKIGSREFAKTIDHTLLKLDAKSVQIDALCAEARVHEFATVCVRPNFVQQCVNNLKGTDVTVASVIGFHEGNYDMYHKIEEVKKALEGGAHELDIVLNYDELKGRQYASVFNELATLRLQAPHPMLLKLIIETSQLDRPQIIAACTIAAAANFDFVKTSTGFNGHGAKEEHVQLMAACCEKLAQGSRNGKKMRVKASGGIRTIDDAVKMLQAGASRLGTSGGVWILKEAREKRERSETPPSARGGGNGSPRPGLTTRLFTDY